MNDECCTYPWGRVVICATAFLTMSDVAWACMPDAPPVDTQTLIEAEETLKNSESAIQRVLAFETLLRTNNPSARQAVIRMGYGMDDDIRATALRCKFLESSKLTIDSLPLDEADDAMPDMTEKAVTMVAEGRTFSFPFYYVDTKTGCASINGHYDEECVPSLSATVSGIAVAFTADRHLFGRFELGDDGRLIGQIGIWHGSGHDIIPAIAILD